MYMSVQEIIDDSKKNNLPVSELMINQEVEQTHVSREQVWKQMEKNLDTMKQAVKKGIQGKGVFSKTGLTGGEAVLLKNYREKGTTLSGDSMVQAVQNAISSNEVNASMGVVCATPTAGSAGTLPGILFTITDRLKLNHEQQVRFLFTAGAFGMVVANNAGIAGATGGCQAEVGSASAMGAAAAVEAAGGNVVQSAEALAMAISNLLGLVCDPVAGLVELPCVKRNAIGTANGLISADMALAGCTNKIPADEVISAMDKVGKGLPKELRETGLGGLAATPTGLKMKMQIFGSEVKVD